MTNICSNAAGTILFVLYVAFLILLFTTTAAMAFQLTWDILKRK